MSRLKNLTIEGFKSIREQTLVFAPLNVFIGSNGSGKSNLIEVFRFLREIVNQNLRGYTAVKGGADVLLHFGRRKSETMTLLLRFREGALNNYESHYNLKLRGTDEDSLIISKEIVAGPAQLWDMPVSSFARESGLRQADNVFARQVLEDVGNFRVYHFHDTSDTAAVKTTCDVDDNRDLRLQAENLAAFLYWLQEKRPGHFASIQATVRQIAPFFDEFRLAPSKLNESKIRLEWKEKGSDTYFNAPSLSDGTLRFMCLATLLLQPELPSVVLLDEPELGLHPAAITLLADLLASASTRAQVIVATQSVTLVNQFEPEQVWTVDREDGQSVFRHLSSADMTQWLDDYALGDLWEKNILGARP